MEAPLDVDDLLGLVPAPALHLRDGALEAANGLARRLLTHPDGLLAALHQPDRTRLLSEADADAGTDADAGADAAGRTMTLRLGDHPPHRFVDASFGPHPAGGTVVVLHDVTERERLDAALAEVATGVYLTDAELRATWISARVGASVGLPPESFVGRDVYGLIHPDDVESTRAMVASAIARPGVRCSSRLRVHQPDQPDVWWPIVVHVVWRGDDPAIGGLFVRFDMDLTAGAHQQEAEETAQTIVTLGSSSLTGALHLDLDGRLLQRSTRVREILRPIADDADLRWLELVASDHREVVAAHLDAARGGTPLPAGEVAFAAGSTAVWVRFEVLPYRNTHGAVVGMFVNVTDLTDEHEARAALAAAREELWHLANHDALTGLANRYRLNEQLHTALAGVSVDGDHAARPGLIVCDLDRFKEVNDRHGHRVGDDVLIEAARRIRSAVRPHDLVCRFGGDEFVVLCPDLTPGELDALVGSVVAAFDTPISAGPLAFEVGVSAGGALAEPGDADDPDTLVLRADRAMYAAKAARRAASTGT